MDKLLTLLWGKSYRAIQRYINKIRLINLKVMGAKIGRGVKVYGRFTTIGDVRNLEIGDYTTINEGVLFNLREKIVIGKSVHLSSYSQYITTSLEHKVNPKKHISSPIYIDNNVWIASSSIITMGVTIKQNSIVGSNSLVLSDIEENSLYAGSPAKKIKEI